MKKKKVIITIIGILALWVAAGIVAFSRVNRLERPLFCVCTESLDDGGSGHYAGLGYSFDIEGNFMPDTENPSVTAYKGYILGVEVCSSSPIIINPSVQEYVAGQGNIKGNVPVEEYISISEDFAIGADKNGYAVFKDPVKALDKLMELYSDGINLIQKSFELESLSADNCGDYKVYGSQTTAGTEREQQQALFVAKFHDIYENSYVRQYPNLHSGEQQKNICRLVPQRRLKLS